MKVAAAWAKLFSKLSRGWWAFLILCLVAGTALRLSFVEDMEYKEDEMFNFTQSQIVGKKIPWPWLGIASGVYLPNPGMSVWVFAWLARIARATSPTELATALQIFAILGICLIIPFALRWVREQEREIWLWAYAIAMVNPFSVFYQRKLWPEPFLPFFSMLVIMGWWKREHRVGAFVWGLVGALLGQIHMSGFFFAGGIFLWTVIFGRRPKKPLAQTEWGFWFLGSLLGALPLIPWFKYIFAHPAGGRVSTGWMEMIQLKFWVFWITDSLGLHLGNPLGLARGPGLAQISDFVRYPIVGGVPTYLNGLAHLVVAGAALVAVGQALRGFWKHRKHGRDLLVGRESETAFLQNSVLWGHGILITITGVVIRRYYMMVTFPLEFIWLVRAASSQPARARKLLITLWVAECFISANFVGYIHVNGGSTWGDYGAAYRLIKDQIKNPQEPWSPELFPQNAPKQD